MTYIKSIVNINPKLNMWNQIITPSEDENEGKLIHIPAKGDLTVNS